MYIKTGVMTHRIRPWQEATVVVCPRSVLLKESKPGWVILEGIVEW